MLAKYRDELAVLSMCGRPLLPVLNFVSSSQHREQDWRDALARLGLHALVCFDSVAPPLDGERRLYDSLALLQEKARPQLQRLIDDHLAQRQLRKSSAARLIAELLVDGDQVSYAALILFGTRAGLTRWLAQAELVFEYRSSEAAGPAADREEYRAGFFAWQDLLWKKINLRNDRQSYQDDFFRMDLPTFDEVPVREAILNAVAHRDYRLGGSIFVRQFAKRLEVMSPGGLPPGITPENIIDQQNPRNRRLAEALGLPLLAVTDMNELLCCADYGCGRSQRHSDEQMFAAQPGE